jgi:hypothetical protein
MKIHLIIASMFAACSMYAANPIEALQQEVAELRQQLASQQQQLAALRPLAALAPFITVDLSPEDGVKGPNIVFHGANVHIIAGSLATASVESEGLGNLIVGRDPESPYHPPFPRTGTENLVIGWYNGFTGTNSIVGGMDNTADGDGNFIVGYWNKVVGNRSSIIGGVSNAEGIIDGSSGPLQ